MKKKTAVLCTVIKGNKPNDLDRRQIQVLPQLQAINALSLSLSLSLIDLSRDVSERIIQVLHAKSYRKTNTVLQTQLRRSVEAQIRQTEQPLILIFRNSIHGFLLY